MSLCGLESLIHNVLLDAEPLGGVEEMGDILVQASNFSLSHFSYPESSGVNYLSRIGSATLSPWMNSR